MVPKHVVILLRISTERPELYKGSSMTLLCSAGSLFWLFRRDKKARQTAAGPEAMLEARNDGALRERCGSVDGCDAGNAPTLTVDHLLGFEQLVERYKANSVAALVELVVVQPGDLHAIDPGLLADALGHVGD
jgi:hypothetical protein